MPFKKLLLLALLTVASSAGASSLFEDDTVLELNLSGPLSSLFEDKKSRTELPFLLTANGVEHTIKVRVRGKSRTRVCSFPPLRLEFAGGETTQTIFAGQNKLKLVTHCRDSDAAQQDTLEEYAAYRIFNVISDVSYKVRLLHITYTDTDGLLDETSFKRYGFLIESATGLAERVGGTPVHAEGVSPHSYDSQQAATVFVFEYLIGNTDWSLVTADKDDTCCHNVDLFDIGSNHHYVPYDFDLSGLVNARYARPDPSVGNSRVTQRAYRGYCVSTDALKNALGDIQARRVDILDVINQLPGLSEKSIKKAKKYLDQFFSQANDVEKTARSFERRCL